MASPWFLGPGVETVCWGGEWVGVKGYRVSLNIFKLFFEIILDLQESCKIIQNIHSAYMLTASRKSCSRHINVGEYSELND